MKKKFLIVVISLVAICAVLGLDDRLNYEGLQNAADMVKASAQDVRDDVSVLGLFGRVLTDYSPTVEQELAIIAGGSNTSGMTYSIRYKATYTDDSGYPVYSEYFGSWDSYHEAEKYVDMLTPMLGSSQAPAGNLEYVAFAFSVLISAVWVFLLGLLDCFGVVWSMVEAVFYLLGF